MLPLEGSVKDGRTIVYLERLSPSGGGPQDQGGQAGKTGDSDKASSSGSGNKPAGPDAKSGGPRKGKASDAPNKPTSGKAAKRATLTTKPLLPASQEAAAKNQAASMRAAAESGAPFCEDCAEAHRLLEEASRTA